MRIEPSIVGRHWEAAAVDQMAANLSADGYEVERQAQYGDLVADLVARRDDETIVYEFKVPGEGGQKWARHASRLRARAVEQGARFRLVFVRPPRTTEVEVEALDSSLLAYLRGQPQWLERLSTLAMGHPTIADVHDVEVDSIEVRPREVAVAGNATVSLSWIAEGEPLNEFDLPFGFAVTLDRDGRVKEVMRLEVDTSPWLDDADAALEPEDEQPPAGP